MRAVLLACFFLSGASGLILESLWTRELGLVFGSTTLAISTVLATFMGGLGLGSYIAGRYADRIKNPVRAYALAEAGVGVYALFIPLILKAYPGFNSWMYRVLGDHFLLLSTVRFAGSALLLLIPTTLMGATLPLLSRHFVMRPWELRRSGLRIGTLYAVNLFGAVAGAYFAGFVFLPLIGVTWTNVTAATFNLTLAAAIVIARSRLPDADTAVAAHLETTALPPPPEITARARRAVMAAFAVSGATAMTLQVLWTRSLAIVIGSSIFSFTLILLAFLVGLGVGAAVVARLTKRSRDPVAW